MKNDYLSSIRFEITGGSHEKEISLKADGLPIGFTPDLDRLNAFMSRRKSGNAEYQTKRKEADIPLFESGIENGKLNGKPLIAVIKNTDVKAQDYKEISYKPRPGHADYTSFVKYGKIESGGGRFSGRMTAPFCLLGGICMQILESRGIKIISRISEIGGIKDEGELKNATGTKAFPTVSEQCGKKMTEAMLKAGAEGDSLGGVIECKIIGAPAGLGGEMAKGIESRVSALCFSVPAVKGIEFGSGFSGARLKGSQNNDEFCYCDGKVVTKTNNCGGILGGISNGMPIEFKVAIKPTPSIAKKQNTVDLKTETDTTLEIKGRHDVCIVPRCVVCIESAAAIAVADMLLCNEKAETLSDLRSKLDRADADIISAFVSRMEISKEIAALKQKNKLAVYDKKREEEKLKSVAESMPDEYKAYGTELFTQLMDISKKEQTSILNRGKKFGLLGKNLSHSFSPEIHKLLYGYSYELFDTDDINIFFKNCDFDGINVTSPYKKAVIEFMDFLSDTARLTGSVNTVVKDKNGKLTGYNTDVFGFINTVISNGIDVKGKKAVVLGTGGASGSVVFALKKLGAGEIVLISRNGINNYQNIINHKNADIIVNATPVGMYPDNLSCKVDLSVFTKLSAVIDLIYNPYKTKLLSEAEKLGIKAVNGLFMLVSQAKKSGELFLDTEFSSEITDIAYKKLKEKAQNIVLIGMPGVGKTVTAEKLAQITGKTAIDTDRLIAEKYKKTPARIITEKGEEYFRIIETEVLKDAAAKSGRVISCGGGVVERAENKDILRQNGIVVYIKRNIKELNTDNRPVSQKTGVEKLFKKREPLYNDFCDVCVELGDKEEENADRILEAIK